MPGEFNISRMFRGVAHATPRFSAVGLQIGLHVTALQPALGANVPENQRSRKQADHEKLYRGAEGGTRSSDMTVRVMECQRNSRCVLEQLSSWQ